MKKQVVKTFEYSVSSAQGIERLKRLLASTNPTVVVIAGRCDGIGFPNDG